MLEARRSGEGLVRGIGGESTAGGSRRGSRTCVDRVYLAAPSQRLSGSTDGVISPVMLEGMSVWRAALLDCGAAVYSAHHDVAWTLREEEGAPLAGPFSALRQADVVFALVADRASTGVGLELGWATASSKPVVLLVNRAQIHHILIRQLEMATAVLPLVFDASAAPDVLRHTAAMALDWADGVSEDRWRV